MRQPSLYLFGLLLIIHLVNAQTSDCTNPLNGPNRQGCGRGQCVDTVPNDQRFTCNCNNTGFAGSNCQIPAWTPVLRIGRDNITSYEAASVWTQDGDLNPQFNITTLRNTNTSAKWVIFNTLPFRRIRYCAEECILDPIWNQRCPCFEWEFSNTWSSAKALFNGPYIELPIDPSVIAATLGNPDWRSMECKAIQIGFNIFRTGGQNLASARIGYVGLRADIYCPTTNAPLANTTEGWAAYGLGIRGKTGGSDLIGAGYTTWGSRSINVDGIDNWFPRSFNAILMVAAWDITNFVPVTCGTPDPSLIANGYFDPACSGTPNWETCRVICNSGFVGGGNATCVEGRWDDNRLPLPICVSNLEAKFGDGWFGLDEQTGNGGFRPYSGFSGWTSLYWHRPWANMGGPLATYPIQEYKFPAEQVVALTTLYNRSSNNDPIANIFTQLDAGDTRRVRALIKRPSTRPWHHVEIGENMAVFAGPVGVQNMFVDGEYPKTAKFELGRTIITDFLASAGWTRVNFVNTFNVVPVVVANLMTTPVNRFVTLRIRNVSPTGFEVAMQSEVNLTYPVTWEFAGWRTMTSRRGNSSCSWTPTDTSNWGLYAWRNNSGFCGSQGDWVDHSLGRNFTIVQVATRGVGSHNYTGPPIYTSVFNIEVYSGPTLVYSAVNATGNTDADTIVWWRFPSPVFGDRVRFTIVDFNTIPGFRSGVWVDITNVDPERTRWHVGYFAAEPGCYVLEGGHPMVVTSTTQNEALKTINFGAQCGTAFFLTTPRAIGSIMTFNDPDPAWLRISNTNAGTTQYQTFIQEEIPGAVHATETAGYVFWEMRYGGGNTWLYNTINLSRRSRQIQIPVAQWVFSTRYYLADDWVDQFTVRVATLNGRNISSNPRVWGDPATFNRSMNWCNYLLAARDVRPANRAGQSGYDWTSKDQPFITATLAGTNCQPPNSNGSYFLKCDSPIPKPFSFHYVSLWWGDYQTPQQWDRFLVEIEILYPAPVALTLFPLSGRTAGGWITGEITTATGNYWPPDSYLQIGPFTCSNKTYNRQSQKIQSVICSIPPGVGVNHTVTVVTSEGNLTVGTFSYNPPVINLASPSSIPTAGGLIDLSGDNFGGVNFATATVIVAGQNTSQPCTVVSVSPNNRNLQCQVPAGQDSGTITVCVGIGSNVQCTVPWPFVYSPPIINSIFPQGLSTAGGQLVTIAGSNFGLVSSATIDGKPCVRNNALSNHTALVCTLPEGLGTGLTVTVTVGPYSTSVFGVQGYSYGPPLVSSISPVNGPTVGGFNLTIVGGSLGFSSAVVTLGSPVTRPCTVLSQTHSQIICQVTADAGRGKRLGLIVGAQSLSQVVFFDFDPPTLSAAFTAANQGSTQGFTVVPTAVMTIQGSNFGPSGTSITVQVGVSNCPVISNTQTQLTCQLPEGDGTDNVVSIAVSGQASTNTRIYAYDPPQINLVNPTLWNTDGSTIVTITGVNFGRYTTLVSVLLLPGNLPCVIPPSNPAARSHTTILCFAPVAQGLGYSLRLTVANQTANTGSIYGYNAPTITSVVPSNGPTTGNIITTITGTQFGPSPVINIAGRPCTVQTRSATSIQCTIPVGEGATNNLTVDFSGRVASTNFRYDAPVITALNPTSALATANINVTLTGRNFGLSNNLRSIVLQNQPFNRNITITTISGDHNQLVLVVPPGTGGNLIPLLTIAGQGPATLSPSTIRFSYAIPVVTVVSGCTTDRFPNTTDCATLANSTLSITGNNFGTVASDVVVLIDGTVPCFPNVNGFTNTFFTCVAQPRPTGGFDLPILVNVTGQSSVPSVAVSYRGPSILVLTPATFPNTTGGGILTLYGFNFGNTDLVVEFGKGSDFIFNCTDAYNSQQFAQIFEVRCTIPPAVGKDLNVRIKVTGPQTSLPSTFTLGFPVPEFIGGTIRTELNDSTVRTTLAGTLTSGEKIYFNAKFVGDRASLLKVYYGSVSNPKKYQCVGVTIEAGNATTEVKTLKCETVSPIDDETGPFAFLIDAYGQQSVQSTDKYSYPKVPTVFRVTGCSENGGVIFNGTTECPTVGGVDITIEGDSFSVSQSIVKVGGKSCAIKRADTNLIVCTIPAGAGFRSAIEVSTLGLFSRPARLLSYAAPTITMINSDNCTQSGSWPVDCPREGNFLITLTGSNFAASGTVLVGSRICVNQNVPSATHTTAVCLVSSGTSDYDVYLLQDNGVISRNAGKISYFRCPTGQFALPDQIACETCAMGTYSATSGQTVCLDCEPGFFAASEGSSFCSSCQAGKFQGSPRANTCTNCSIGYYSDSLSQFQCKQCETGRFQADGETFCADCQPGFVQPSPAATGCISCLKGSFSPVPRSLSCSLCDAGSTAKNDNASVCDLCPGGSIAPTTGLSDCTSCPEGTFTPTPGFSACRPCPSGTFSDQPGSTSCNICPAGFYSLSSGDIGPTVCIPCPSGSFQNAPGQADCTPCPAGTYSLIDVVFGTQSCIACNEGYYAPASSSVECSVCQPGYYTDVKGQTLCKPCSPGTVNPFNASSSCSACLPGTVQGQAFQLACVDCDPGYYQDELGGLACKACAPGRYANDSHMDLCYSCPVGTTSKASLASTGCDNCEAGTYNNAEGVYLCFACAPGSYSNTSAAQGCTLCPDGQYALSSRATECQPCEAGRTRRGTTLQCSDCPSGSYQDQEGQGDCILCPAGSYGDVVKAKSCTPCANGRFTAGVGASDCTGCPAGKYGPAKNLTACFDCEPGFAQSLSGQGNCAECDLGYYTDSFGRRTCIPCDPGFIANNTASLRCRACIAGTYSPLEASSECFDCDAGSFNPANGQSTCFTCPPGKANPLLAQTACATCDAGFVAEQAGLYECSPCAVGFFSPAPGQSRCTICPKGTRNPYINASQCIECLPGYFAASRGSLTCDFCIPGTYASNATSTTCLLCETGKFTFNNASDNCGECAPGYYQDEVRATSCKPCQISTSNALPGLGTPCAVCEEGKVAASPAQETCDTCRAHSVTNLFQTECFCEPGYYDAETPGRVVDCLSCPRGANCLSPGTKFSTIISREGWWRSTNDSLTFYRCFRDSQCPGGVAGNAICSGQAIGPLCANCPDGYIKDTEVTCKRCPTKGTSIFQFILIVLSALVLLTIQLNIILRSGSDLWRQQARLRQEFRDKNTKAQQLAIRHGEVDDAQIHAPPAPPPDWTYKLKILLSFLQITTAIATNIEIVWPQTFKDFLNVFYPLQLDLVSMSSIDCLYSTNFYTRFMAWTIIPASIGVVVMIFFVLPKYIRADRLARGEIGTESDIVELKKKKARQKAWKIVIFILFLIYPTISQNITKLYVCTQVEGKSYIRADMRVECFTPKWNKYAAWGAVSLIIYPIGIPVFFFYMLWKYRLRLFEPGVQAQLGFLYAGYSREAWWFEAVDMVHKLFLTSLLGFFPFESQIPVGMVVIMLYACVIFYFKPYLRKGDDRLHLIGQIEIYIFMLAGWMFRNSVDFDKTTDRALSAILIILTILFVGFFVLQAIFIVYKKYRQYKAGGGKSKADGPDASSAALLDPSRGDFASSPVPQGEYKSADVPASSPSPAAEPSPAAGVAGIPPAAVPDLVEDEPARAAPQPEPVGYDDTVGQPLHDAEYDA